MSRKMEMGLIILLSLLVPLCASVDLSTYRSLFMRMPLLQLSSLPEKVEKETTVEDCARLCVKESDFLCRSFDFDNNFRECRLHNTTRDDARAVLASSTHVDHYRSAFEKIFTRLPNHVVILRHNRKVSRLSVEECARRCVYEMEFRCRGFDYEESERTCWLTEMTPQTAGGVQRLEGADYYQRVEEGSLANFICYGFGSLPTLEGYQVYNQVFVGVTLEACGQLCMAQTLFRCVSFDYAFSDQSCHLSEYLAGNLQGLRTEHSPENKVIHYERIEEFLTYFYPTPNAVVLGNNDKTFFRVTADRCARNCLEERSFVCRSFDYQVKGGQCMLSTKTGSDVGGLYKQGLAQVHHFEMKPFLDCGGVLTSDSGSLASPNWPRHYSHHVSCNWHLKVPSNKIIHLDFSHIDLGPESQNPCDEASDKLIITEQTSHGVVRFCVSKSRGSNDLPSYVSQSNNLNLTFLSNGNYDAQGFRIFYKADWPCHALLTSPEGEVASPGWPVNYPPSLSCVWTIQAPVSHRVALSFTAISLDSDPLGRCGSQTDAVRVYDGDSPGAALLGEFCGSDRPRALLSRFNIILVQFHSDDHGQAKGFHAIYHFLAPTTTPRLTSAPTTPSTTTTTDSGVTSLSAFFLEPGREESTYNSSVTSGPEAESATTWSVGMGSDGGGLKGKYPPDGRATFQRYLNTLWALVIALIILFLIAIVIVVFVCRHYKRRIPKRRNVPNFQFTEENLSLYEKENVRNITNEESVRGSFEEISFSRTTAFSNPMYGRSKNSPQVKEKIEFKDIEQFKDIQELKEIQRYNDIQELNDSQELGSMAEVREATELKEMTPVEVCEDGTLV